MCMCEVQAQRTTVSWVAYDVSYDELMRMKEIPQRRHREVAEVLVVNRVEFSVVHHVPDVRDFDDADSIIGQDQLHAFHDAS